MFGGKDFLPTFAPAIRKKHGAMMKGALLQKLIQARFLKDVQKFLKKSCKKNWKLQKLALPLQSVSLPNLSSEHRTRFFDLLVQLREKCSIYQFLFQRGLSSQALMIY